MYMLKDMACTTQYNYFNLFMYEINRNYSEIKMKILKIINLNVLNRNSEQALELFDNTLANIF